MEVIIVIVGVTTFLSVVWANGLERQQGGDITRAQIVRTAKRRK